MTQTTDTPDFKSPFLADYLRELDGKYVGNLEITAEIVTDGKGHQGLVVTVCLDGNIEEEEDFFYPSHDDMVEDEKLVNQIYYQG